MQLTAKRKKTLAWLFFGLLGFSLVLALLLFFLREQASYYYDPSALTRSHVPAEKMIRAGGVVVAGSLKRDSQNPLEVRFQITDFKHTVSVKYTGILPDLFKENSGVVVQGNWKQGEVYAKTVLAKHDENYMPPEVAKSVQ